MHVEIFMLKQLTDFSNLMSLRWGPGQTFSGIDRKLPRSLLFFFRWFDNFFRLISRTWESTQTNTCLFLHQKCVNLWFSFSETREISQIWFLGENRNETNWHLDRWFSYSHHWVISETCHLGDETQFKHIQIFGHQIHAVVELKLSRSLIFMFIHLHQFWKLLSRRRESDLTSLSESSIASMLGFRMHIILLAAREARKKIAEAHRAIKPCACTHTNKLCLFLHRCVPRHGCEPFYSIINGCEPSYS